MSSPTPRAIELGEILRSAGQLAQKSREQLVRELKPDGSIVTNGDRAVETQLRAQLPSFESKSSFWGEEFGFAEEGEGGLWLVDPVDGTSNYSFGSPLWGVSIALIRKGVLQIGGIFLPDLSELYLAEKDAGAFMNGKPIPPIPPGPIRDEELVSYNDHVLRDFPTIAPPGKMRLSGAFVIDGTYTVMQRFRGLIGRRERLYDVAASVLLGQEVGADIRYADGDPFDMEALARPVPIKKPWIIFPKDSSFFYTK